MKKFLFYLMLITSPLPALAQHSISGTVTSGTTDEALVGANVVVNEHFVIPTNKDGSFNIPNLSGGDYSIKISYLGYKTETISLALTKDEVFSIKLEAAPNLVDEVIVTATRASERIPTTYSTVNKEEIEEKNAGQDIPFLLQQEPSVVVTSDAGAGIGYTGMRIRGSDQSRVNVTINGIPLNDPESQGVFWVNMPDFASSVENIQIQRGLGTSTNGAGAFGGTVNFQTLAFNEKPYANISNSYGSFNSWKHTAEAGTGLINDHFSVDARLSKITSDGYVDRATSDLKSFFISGGYQDKKNILKAVIFSGKEITYQAWYGVPEDMLATNRSWNYYTYENEVDNYQQDHYQLHFSHQFSTNFIFNTALHHTYGRGYFEQFRGDDDFSDYGLADIIIGADTITSSDLIRRRWLDNNLYGMTFSGKYTPGKSWSTIIGGGWNVYEGGHFGEIIWSEFAVNQQIREEYYRNFGLKADFNVFGKMDYQLSNKIGVFADLQYRKVDYKVNGVDNDQRLLNVEADYNFINPKIGGSFRMNSSNSFYAFLGVGHREPDRNDFIDAIEGHTPKPEQLRNVELGYKFQKTKYAISANVYLMDYKDQLVLTGELNDVGTPVRTNVDRSYRAGIELQGGLDIFKKLRWDANATFSRNKIQNYEEIIYVFDENFDLAEIAVNKYEETDISFSPSVIAGSTLTYEIISDLKIALQSKYVGNQFLDNTSSKARALDAYFLNDIRINYSIHNKLFKEISFALLANNIFNELYESNGYTFGWLNMDSEGNKSHEFYNYYYPQAGRNFLLAVTLKI